MSRVTLPPKLVGETVNLAFDFVSRLGVSETISSQSVTCTVYSGVDSSPGSVISGSSSASGTVVTQAVVGGVAGVLYNLKCTAGTSTGETLSLTGILAVLPDSI